jgi:hypothetical protein
VSIIELIARPQAFDKKWITVSGYLQVDMFESTLYLTFEDIRYGLHQNGISVELSIFELLKHRCILSPCLDTGDVNITGIYVAPQPGEINGILTDVVYH